MLKWTVVTPRLSDTPSLKRIPTTRKRRRSSVSNKENIITSTPLPKKLAIDDISMIGLDCNKPVSPKTPPVYASTLPKFAEEYSPSPKLNSGQALAMRGLLPDVYLGNPRYLAKEICNSDETPAKKEQPSLNSSRMGDHTLDKLIDAILESGRKSFKKGARRSLNLRRRTLLKNSTTVEVLSPSYTPAEDPASDLSFSEDIVKKRKLSSPVVATRSLSVKRRSRQRTSPRAHKQSSDNNGNYFEVGLAMPSIYV